MLSGSDKIMEITQSEMAETAPAPEPSPSPAPESSSSAPEMPSEAAPTTDGQPVEAAKGAPEAPKAEEPVSDGTSAAKTEEQKQEEAVEAMLEFLDGSKIPESATIRRKIDGEMREVSLKDALSQYSIRFAGDKRFAEANSIKQKAEHSQRLYSQKEGELKQVADRFIGAMSKGNTRDAVDILCELTGQDTEEVWGQVSKAQREAVQRLKDMDESQWDQYEAKQSAEYYKRKLEYNETRAIEQDLSKWKADVQEKYSLKDEDLQLATKMMLDVKKEKRDNSPLTREEVLGAALDYRTFRTIDETVREHLPNKAGDMALYNEIFEDTKRYNLTKDDWISVLTEIQNESKKKEETSKLAAKVAKNTPPTKPQQTSSKGKSAPTDLIDVGIDLNQIG